MNNLLSMELGIQYKETFRGKTNRNHQLHIKSSYAMTTEKYFETVSGDAGDEDGVRVKTRAKDKFTGLSMKC